MMNTRSESLGSRIRQQFPLILMQPGVQVGICILALAAANITVFWDHWRGTTSFTFDFPMGYYAGTAYWTASVRSGEWPHWIPYESMGFPSVLNPQLGLFYPPFWLMILLRFPYTLHAANVVQVMHVLFGAIGFFLLVRRIIGGNTVALLGGLSFGLFGGFFTNSEHPDIIRAFAWIPWLFWCAVINNVSGEGETPAQRFRTNLRLHNIFLPLFVGTFITGAYPGLITSVLLILAVFIVAQAVIVFRRYERIIPLRDAAIQFGEVALGAVISGVYLIPTAFMSSELSRAHDFRTLSRVYIGLRDLSNLVFPSNFLRTEDYSMFGMQIPLVVLLFLPFANARLKRLVPLLACGLAAAVMCMSETSGFSALVIKCFPALGLSRFPAGDYRIFIYIAVLIWAIAGVEVLVNDHSPELWRYLAGMLFVMVAIVVGALTIMSAIASADRITFLRSTLILVAAGLAATVSFALWAKLHVLRWMWIAAIVMTTFITGVEIARDMRSYWSDPAIERTFYNNRGLPLLGSNHDLQALRIFSRNETTRPPRIQTKGFLDLSWRGYIDGSYTIDENVKSLSEQRILSSPALIAVMRQGSELFVIDCTPQLCGNATIDGVALPPADTTARTVSYSRNVIVYEVALRTQSLVIENETFAPGWEAHCDFDGNVIHERRVDGALRGWVIPAGKHHVRVVFRTPRLLAGVAVSLGGICAWLASLVAYIVFVKRRNCRNHRSSSCLN